MTAATLIPQHEKTLSLENWLENPPERTEWVNGELLEKNGMTLKHSKIQNRLGYYWTTYKNSSNLGGEVYAEVPCRTQKQGRSPDIAYLTPELVEEYSDAKVLPRSFPLTAEIISPTDFAEDIIAKADEYLQSGAEEVWLVFPENCWVIIITQDSKQIFASGEIVSTQKILLGFSIAIDELLG